MHANTVELREWLRVHRGVALADYEALRRWSVADVGVFWDALREYFDVEATPYSRTLDGKMPDVRWFAGAELSYVAHLQRYRDRREPAVVFRNERLQRERRSVEISWRTLLDRTAALAATLRSLGVVRGDRVVAYLPNIPEALIAFLASASLGAIFSICATDMGVPTVRDRFRQIAPKILIACDGTVYGGKIADRRETVAALQAELPSIETTILVSYLEQAGGPHVAPLPRTIPWADALSTTERVPPASVPFEHPLWIVYSSGTTGLPKPIVHGHGGVMLEMLKLHAFHLDLRVDDRLHWYSSSGWVMWNLGLSALLLGNTICVYDGHPSYPQLDTLWRFVDETNVTAFGAGAAYYTSCMKAGVSPKASVDVSRLRMLGSTGSPLPPEAYAWAQEHVRADLWWGVISGGTDLASAFLGGTPELPTVPGEMQARCLGADVHAWDEQGRSVIDEVGELVCVQPMPSMPLYFWGDTDGRRYRESYFDVYPGVWRHGDWLRITPSGGGIIYGRSDATLNRHGHRLGTSELYRVVEALPQIVDSLVVDLEYLGRPSWMPLFVAVRAGDRLDDSLRDEIRRRVKESLSPRFVPDEIVEVPEIPRTLTGKKLELPIKKLLLGRTLADVMNKDACANPAAFEPFLAYARAQAQRTETP